MDKLEITYGMTSCNRNAYNRRHISCLPASRSDKRARRIPLETGLTKIECECQWLPISCYNSSFR